MFDPSTFDTGRGGMVALDAATGRPRWTRDFDQMALGGATVTGDLVFTSDYAGYIYALNAATGATVWSTRARAGINTTPAIAGDMLLVAAGAGVGPVAGPPDDFPQPSHTRAHRLPPDLTWRYAWTRSPPGRGGPAKHWRPWPCSSRPRWPSGRPRPIRSRTATP